MKYLLKDVVFLPFVPLMYLTDLLAQIGVGVFSKDEPEFSLKNVLALLGFIIISPLLIVMTPIQRAYIHHLQEKMEHNKKSEQFSSGDG
jgi:hypothetical protein